MRRLAAAVGSWLVAAAVYLGFAGSVSRPEIIAAATCAAFVLGFAFWCRHARPTPLRPRAPWLRLAPRIIRTLGIETLLVGGALLRSLAGARVRGEMLTQPFDPGGDSPAAAARRAIAVLAASTAPDGYVVAIESRSLRLHRLVPRPPAPDRRWPI